MSELRPVTVLGAARPQTATVGSLAIRENSGVALASLTLRQGGKLTSVFALDLPSPGGWVAREKIAALWIGPNQWMIEAQDRAGDNFAAELKHAVPAFSVTDQTDGWVTFEIVSRSGTAPLEWLLSKLVNVDFRDLGPGRSKRTELHHMSCFVIRRSEFEIALRGGRSFATSLWHALGTAARTLAQQAG